MDKFWMLDGRDVWWKAAFAAGHEFGFACERINVFDPRMAAGDTGFVRPTAAPGKREAQIRAYFDMQESGLRMVQDAWNVAYYDDKVGQLERLRAWLPSTWLFRSRREALEFVKGCQYPLVSKAAVGASSVNVRILRNAREGVKHVMDVFGRGVRVAHCAAGAHSAQKGYVYFQSFIPHTETWRVNILGGGRAVFRRFNSRDRPVAQTGNVAPVMEMTHEVESVLEFADEIAAALGTGWCAFDILRYADRLDRKSVV